MLRFATELVGEHLVPEAAVFFTEALAKLNARQFIREEAEGRGEDLPCCARCAGCVLDTSAAVQDCMRLLETRSAHPVSIVAYSAGRELARGRPCRVVLIGGERLGYEVEDGEIEDPLLRYEELEEECCCGRDHQIGD